MRARIFIAVIALISALLGAGHVWDSARRRAVLESYLGGADHGATTIVMKYAPRVGNCRLTSGNRPAALASAFLTVETFVTPLLRHAGSYAFVMVSEALHWELPNLTLGPGRIRYSTAQRILAKSGHVTRSSGSLGLSLFSPCTAQSVAEAILAEALQAGDDLDYDDIQRVCRIYNGQNAQHRDLEARLSGHVYCRLVYDVFQTLLFDRLATKGPSRGSSEVGGARVLVERANKGI